MKNVLLFLVCFVPIFLFSQSRSWDGRGIRSDEKIHYLNIFVNIIYDVHPECNDQFQNSQFWPPISDPALEGINNAAIPTYLLDWMDTVYVPGQLHGSCTRLYGESSFDSLQITGDFIVVNLRESTVLNHGSFNRYNIRKVALDMISDNSAVTLYGRKHREDFNAMNVLIRNITLAYGGINPGSGSGGVSTLQCVGDGDFFANPTNIVTHEISHGLFGTNDFHTSGGNHRDVGCAMPFLNIQGGYGLMGAANSGLVGCNGYERWRMHWKHPQAVDYVSARNTSNTASVVSDISIEDGNKSFLLRDFVTYGDVVRIKLPYKDSENSPNQYIWLENHKIGENDKLDYLQYSNTHSCRPRGAAGIYAYYQVGRDVLEGTNSQVWDSYGRDNLRIISAEGFHDYVVVEDNYNLHCVSDNSHSYAMVRGKANPFGGYNDQEKQIVPADEDTVLYVANELAPWRIVVEGQNRDFIPFIGDNSDAFTGHTVINMGTNPSTCNTRTFHSNNPNHSIVINASSQEKNTSTTYLSGLSIEMVPVAGTGDFIINVTWDGYDITNDVRFTGNVALRDTAVLTQGNTITLAQNRTVAQDRRDPETGLFAGKTHFTLLSGSFFRQDTTSVLSLTENSDITVEAGAGYELGAGATLHVGAGCKATFSPDAFVTLKGIVDIDSGGVMTIYDTAYIGSQARIIVHPGGKLIVDGGTLTNASAGKMWRGIEVMGNPDKSQQERHQGYVDLKNGATIENAYCAILTGLHGDNGANSGGIVKAANTTFRNNSRSVNMLPYADVLSGGTIRGNLANFSYCTFTNDTNNLFTQNGTRFFEHVRLWDVNNVEFYSCSFSNTQTTPSLSGYRAIYSEDAGFIVSKGCPNNIVFQNCVCPESYSPYNTFTGFNRAIESNTTGNQYAIRIDQSKFYGNDEGIRVNGNNFVTITRDSFNLSAGASEVANRIGLYINNCTGYKVEQNNFMGGGTIPLGIVGILVDNSGTADNVLYRNSFSNIDAGVLVHGNNGDEKRGLYVSCADFNNVLHDIVLVAGATMKTTLNVTENNCVSTLCEMWPGPPVPYNVFAAMVEVSENNITGDADAHNTVASDYSPLQRTYYDAVRSIMCDTVVDLGVLRQWHAAAKSLAAPNSLTETEFQMGNVEANNHSPVQAETTGVFNPETANYAQFHAMKMELSAESGMVANDYSLLQWTLITDSQITKLQEIAELNTGRASEMAKGVLCFFHEICYEDENDFATTIKSAKTHPKGSYESFFGNSSWEYDIYYLLTCYSDEYNPNFFNTCSGTLSFEFDVQDTVMVDDKLYYKNSADISLTALLREDSTNGRLYARYMSGDDEEYLLCDMSLSEGDTFTLKGNSIWHYDDNDIKMVVDSVAFVSGKKVIYLTCVNNDYFYDYFYANSAEVAEYFKQYNISLRFIEGVGPIYGIFPPSNQITLETHLPLLLCVHKDDTLCYMTHEVLGCYQTGSDVPVYQMPSMQIMPNPATTSITLSFETEEEVSGNIIIRDMVGRVCASLDITGNNSVIGISNLTQGIYALTYTDKKNRRVTKKFVKM